MNNAERPIGLTDRPSPTVSLWWFLYAVLALVGGSMLFVIAPGLLGQTKTSYYLATMLVEVVAFGLPVALYYDRMPHMRPAMRVRRIDGGAMFLVALSAAAGAIALNMLLTFWLALLESIGYPLTQAGTPMPGNNGELWVAVLAIAVVPAVAEELFFRGFLLPSFEPWGKRFATLVSGLLFALLHSSLEGFPSQLLIGLLVGWFVCVSGSLHTAIVYHCVNNATILLAAYALSGYIPDAQAIEASVDMLSLLSPAAWSVGIWVFLIVLAKRRIGRAADDALPAADRRRWPRKATVLLAASMAVLLWMFVSGILAQVAAL